MARHNETGKKGEDIAVNFLIENGYAILCRNWKRQNAEIDIIASTSEYLVFVEVKTRSSDLWGMPEDAVSKQKMNQIVKGAALYIEENEIGELEPRFDIVAVVLDKNNVNIEHIEDAFFPTLK